MIKRHLFLLLVFLTMASSTWALQKNFVKAQVDQGTVNIGDPLVYTVEVMTAGETQYSPDIILPSFGRNFQVGQIFTRSSVSILNGRTYIVNFKEVHLVVRKSGKVVIPESKVEMVDPQTKKRFVEQSNTVEIEVQSPTGQKAAATPTPEIDVLRPIKKKAHITLNQWLPFGIGGFLIAAIFGIMLYLKYRPEPKEKGPQGPVDNRTPEQRAFDDLEEAVKLKEEGKVNEYFSLLSVIVRRYLSEQYEIRAQESTTKELVKEMEENRFKEFFMEKYHQYAVNSDEVKFAGKMPTREEIEKIFPEVKSLIMEKHIQYPPPEPDPEPDEDETLPSDGENQEAAPQASDEKENDAAQQGK